MTAHTSASHSHCPSRLIAISLVLAASPVGAATITVDPTCTLVDAITAANTDTSTGGCPAGRGEDTIKLTGDVTLTTPNNTDLQGANGLPVVTSGLSIDGRGHAIKRIPILDSDGGENGFRLLAVAASGNLLLNRVTLTNGTVSGDCDFVSNLFCAGGLYNEGTVTLLDSTVSGNGRLPARPMPLPPDPRDPRSSRCGGIENNGAMNIANSTIYDNIAVAGQPATTGRGGGICNGGTLALFNSTVSGNYAAGAIPDGGGIVNFGTMLLIHSVVSENELFPSSIGGGETGGSGLSVIDGSVTLINSLIANNTVGEGVFFDCGTSIPLRGINASGSLTEGSGSITFQGKNLIGDGSCDATANDQLTGDPLLEPLADNGGPTLTHALRQGSPAIDQIDFIYRQNGKSERGKPLGCEETTDGTAVGIIADQRGVRRPQPVHGKCDIGAYELRQKPGNQNQLERIGE